MNLNTCQQEAYDKILAFLFNEEKYFILSGGPGHGKTYLANYIYENLIRQYRHAISAIGDTPIYNSLYLTATTNSAVDSLASAGESNTIFSLLGLYVWQGNLKQRNSHAGGNILSPAVVIIDEYTLIDDDLMGFIQSGLGNCKIIFMGDKDQLLAIKGISSILGSMEPNHVLTIPQRTNDPDILHLIEEFKQLVHGNSIDEVPINNQSITHITDEEFARLIWNPNTCFDNARIITQTNADAIEINNDIREAKGLPDHFVVGEVVTNNTYVLIGKLAIGTDADLIIENYHGNFTVDLGDELREFPRYSVRRGNSEHTILHISKQERDLILQSDQIPNYGRHFIEESCDIRSTYASTIYKAQGRTFETVYINLSGFTGNTTRDVLVRSMFVAASRAAKNVIFIGELHENLMRKL